MRDGLPGQIKSLLLARDYFPPQVGGISRLMADVCTALGPRGVCCVTDVPASRRGGLATDVRVYRRTGIFKRESAQDLLQLGWTIAQILLVERPRVVQLASCNDAGLGLLLDRAFRIPFVSWAHGNEVLEARRGTWPKNLSTLRRARRVLATSRFTANLVADCGVEPARIVTINPGCDIHRYRPVELSAEARARIRRVEGRGPTILSVGNLVERKGHEKVLRALPDLRQRFPGIAYLIVGTGPYESTLRRVAAGLGVLDRVVFCGSVPDDEMADYYAACDVFALLSSARLQECDVEGFGIVLLEAGACGKPVVAVRSGGIGDAVEDGRSGLLVEDDDLAGLRDTLAEILGNRELASRLGEWGRQRAVRNFSWEVVGGRIGAVLHEVAHEPWRGSTQPVVPIPVPGTRISERR